MKNSIVTKLFKLLQQAEMSDEIPRYVCHALYAMHKELIGDNVTKYTSLMVDKIKNASDHLNNGAKLK